MPWRSSLSSRIVRSRLGIPSGANSPGSTTTPHISTSFLLPDVRPHDPCPHLNDRRAAPPWWGSVAALPRPCLCRRRRATDSHVEVQAPWPMTTAPKFRRKNSCPDGWLNAGAKVPIRLTVRQEEYCRQAIDIHRFCYNLAVRTHRFCRRNRLTCGPAGRTSARPSTPASGRTTPS